MNRVKEVERINKADLALQLKSDTVGNSGTWNVDKSWHAQYKDSAYVYVGGLPYDLSEGDVIVIFSQFGEIVDVNLPRDRDTGKPKGFAFIAYEDQRSTILAVDNFNGAQVLGRTLRCDHCASFNEEQKKDANNLPDHVTRKLSEKELAKKKADIEQRNVELDEAGATKAGLFADGRGISESDRRKEAEVATNRSQHIDAVLARRRGEYDSEVANEARQQLQREERRRQREEERKREREVDDEKRRSSVAVPPARDAPAATSAAPDQAAESKFDRMMNGGGARKKKKRPAASMDEGLQRHSATATDTGDKRAGDGISIDETNRLRESLGLKPLRG